MGPDRQGFKSQELIGTCKYFHEDWVDGPEGVGVTEGLSGDGRC